MKMVVLVLLSATLTTVLGQYEEVASVPVKTEQSYICKDHDNPVITQRPEPLYEVDLGDPLKITCGASGIPMPYVYWVKGKKDMTDQERRLPVTAVGQSVLYLESIEKEDVDYYTCVVEDCCKGTIQTVETEIVVRNKAQCTRKQPAPFFWVVVWEFRNWTSSHQFCKDHNMEFAVPRNEEENKALLSLIQESLGADPNGKKFAHHNMVWMGISDGVVEYGFTDINTGHPIQYSNWLPRQPDNWKKYHKEGQDVVAMDRISGEWDDSYGFWKRPFACWCPPKFQRGKGREGE